eukprot:CAMPEP_0203752472 /NCGR_PEP_ID=MMETSP0098-20131031/6394_1 /ASSEMBLY_ACC=CAM_ASM_000208 /TAXON_ID=96639 /ORGANISM=" , Strain NY0313808BC1" /LENGTH=946 /DNA_ID=CAMNT_0050642655 /DNA_START=51 /DNA_END=2888 /DNA_ORIENTATION=-
MKSVLAFAVGLVSFIVAQGHDGACVSDPGSTKQRNKDYLKGQILWFTNWTNLRAEILNGTKNDTNISNLASKLSGGKEVTEVLSILPQGPRYRDQQLRIRQAAQDNRRARWQTFRSWAGRIRNCWSRNPAQRDVLERSLERGTSPSSIREDEIDRAASETAELDDAHLRASSSSLRASSSSVDGLSTDELVVKLRQLREENAILGAENSLLREIPQDVVIARVSEICDKKSPKMSANHPNVSRTDITCQEYLDKLEKTKFGPMTEDFEKYSTMLGDLEERGGLSFLADAGEMLLSFGSIYLQVLPVFIMLFGGSQQPSFESVWERMKPLIEQLFSQRQLEEDLHECRVGLDRFSNANLNTLCGTTNEFKKNQLSTYADEFVGILPELALKCTTLKWQPRDDKSDEDNRLKEMVFGQYFHQMAWGYLNQYKSQWGLDFDSSGPLAQLGQFYNDHYDTHLFDSTIMKDRYDYLKDRVIVSDWVEFNCKWPIFYPCCWYNLTIKAGALNDLADIEPVNYTWKSCDRLDTDLVLDDYKEHYLPYLFSRAFQWLGDLHTMIDPEVLEMTNSNIPCNTSTGFCSYDPDVGQFNHRNECEYANTQLAKDSDFDFAQLAGIHACESHLFCHLNKERNVCEYIGATTELRKCDVSSIKNDTEARIMCQSLENCMWSEDVAQANRCMENTLFDAATEKAVECYVIPADRPDILWECGAMENTRLQGAKYGEPKAMTSPQLCAREAVTLRQMGWTWDPRTLTCQIIGHVTYGTYAEPFTPPSAQHSYSTYSGYWNNCLRRGYYVESKDLSRGRFDSFYAVDELDCQYKTFVTSNVNESIAMFIYNGTTHQCQPLSLGDNHVIKGASTFAHNLGSKLHFDSVMGDLGCSMQWGGYEYSLSIENRKLKTINVHQPNQTNLLMWYQKEGSYTMVCDNPNGPNDPASLRTALFADLEEDQW